MRQSLLPPVPVAHPFRPIWTGGADSLDRSLSRRSVVDLQKPISHTNRWSSIPLTSELLSSHDLVCKIHRLLALCLTLTRF